jgi:histone-lysine N-methyltransferase SETMAR
MGTQENTWELLSHPPYSLDLAPSDYHLFRPLKDHLKGHHYETDEAVQDAMQSWLQGAGMDFYHKSIFKIMQHWQKSINENGDLV